MSSPIIEAIHARIHALELENMPRNARGYYDMPMSVSEYEMLEKYVVSVLVRETEGRLPTGTILVYGAECYIGDKHSFSLPHFGPYKPPKLDANRDGY